MRESQRERVRGRTREEEREGLMEFYQSEGYTRAEAETIVDRITGEMELPIQSSSLEELELAPEELGDPVKAGILCGVSFGLAAIVPILPFAYRAFNITEALWISIVATLASLFGVGAMKTIFSRKSWVRSGLEMMIMGASASAVTYMIGTLFSLIV